MSRWHRAAAAMCAVAVLAGCVSPATNVSTYEAKAALTAQDATSSMRTALLAVHTYGEGDLQAGYLEVVLVESETAIGAVQSTFASVQPPEDDRADRLRARLDALLSEGTAGLAALRIAARRDEPAVLAHTARELTETADALDAFGTEHAS